MTSLAIVAALPWLLSALLRVGVGRLDRLLSPRSAVVLLPILAAVIAFAVASSMAALAAVLLSSGRISGLALGLVIAGWVAWRLVEVSLHVRRVGAGSSIASEFGDEARVTGGIVVVDSDVPDAFAVPSGGGAVVITTALAGALSDNELRAVIDHEHAHLRHRHSFWIQMCQIAAQFDPILLPVTTRVRHAAERQADEIAAAHSRRDTLTAIARIALLRAHIESAPHTLASTGGDIVRRVQALSEPPPQSQGRGVLVAWLVLILACAIISVSLFDVVQDVLTPEIGEAPSSIFR